MSVKVKAVFCNRLRLQKKTPHHLLLSVSQVQTDGGIFHVVQSINHVMHLHRAVLHHLLQHLARAAVGGRPGSSHPPTAGTIMVMHGGTFFILCAGRVMDPLQPRAQKRSSLVREQVGGAGRGVGAALDV